IACSIWIFGSAFSSTLAPNHADMYFHALTTGFGLVISLCLPRAPPALASIVADQERRPHERWRSGRARDLRRLQHRKPGEQCAHVGGDRGPVGGGKNE